MSWFWQPRKRKRREKRQGKKKGNPPPIFFLTLFDTNIDPADRPYRSKNAEKAHENGHRFAEGGKERISVSYL